MPDRIVAFPRCVEEHEPAAARANEFPPGRSCAACLLVPTVDSCIRHAVESSLQLPPLVQILAERVGVPTADLVVKLVGEVPETFEVSLGVTVGRARRDLAEHLGG